MKLTTLHVLTGVGAVLTAVAVGVSTKLASDKVNEVREVRRSQDPSFEDLTGWEKFKIYARYEAAPLAMLAGTCTGIYQCHKTAQNAIETAANVSAAVSPIINGYRDVTREVIGKKKEEEIYAKAMGEKMKIKPTSNLILGENDCVCCIISTAVECVAQGNRLMGKNDLTFISNATKVKEATLDFNNMFVRRVSKSMLNEASASVAEWLMFLGVETDNRILDHLGWSYQHDGTVDIRFIGGLSEDNKPMLGIEFITDPHYID